MRTSPKTGKRPALTRLNATLSLRKRHPALLNRQLTAVSLPQLRVVECLSEPGNDATYTKTDAKV